MGTKYHPVHPDYYEEVEKTISKKETVVVHYFEGKNTLNKTTGRIKEISKNQKNEEFVSFEHAEKIRIDRIIVFNGKPGPAYEEYDRYALACLDCTGGMD